MTKIQAIERMVDRDFHPISTEWVQIISEHKGQEIYAWPMWGTMWQIDEYLGKKLMACSTQIEDEDDEMQGAMQVGKTSMYIYEIDDHYIVGIHGAGYNFYDGVWDRIYDLLDLKWHDNKK